MTPIRIVKQPSGLYAVFSLREHRFTHLHLTAEMLLRLSSVFSWPVREFESLWRDADSLSLWQPTLAELARHHGDGEAAATHQVCK